ncbi:MAG: TRAP transporter substrate-binding protein DctP [Thermodesulfobacteriota bacterium]
MKNRLFLFSLLVLLVVSWVVAGPTYTSAASKVIKWRMQTLWDPGSPEYRLQERFISRVKELSGGRLDITLFPPGGLVPTMEKFDAVSKGVFEMMNSYSGYWMGKLPEIAFTASVPCGFTDAWQYEVWFWEMGGIKMERENWAKHHMYYIAPTVYEQEPMHSKLPIRSLADMKGKKARFVGMATTVMAKLGVGVVSLPTADVYPALEKGVIDFADRGGLAANWAVGLQHVTRYILLPGFHQPTSVVFYAANMDAWKALPEDLKAILEAACREASSILFTHIHAENIKALDKFKKHGIEVIYLPEADVLKAREIAMTVWEEYGAKSPMAKKVLESQKEYMRLLGLIK